MKMIISFGFIGFAMIAASSCSDNKAAENKQLKDGLKKIEEAKQNKSSSPVKQDGPSLGIIETPAYTMKLHNAFVYQPSGSEIMAGMKPKRDNKFIYLDVSLRNKAPEKLNGGFLFIALKVTDENGTEYKKPAAGLAAYTSEQPEASNADEYNALWDDFQKDEFHRDIIYCVEVPANLNSFVLHMPVDKKRKEWKKIAFTVK